MRPLPGVQQGPLALRPPRETRLAGRIRRRGKRLQADRREPVHAVGLPLIESGRQRPARHQVLNRLPQSEGPLRRSRPTKNLGRTRGIGEILPFSAG